MQDTIALLITSGVAAYLLWHYWGRYSKENALYDVYCMVGFAVLLVSGLLLLTLGLGILKSPYVLTVATLIPLGISIGVMEQYLRKYKKLFKRFALLGFLAIAVSAIGGLSWSRKSRCLFSTMLPDL